MHNLKLRLYLLIIVTTLPFIVYSIYSHNLNIQAQKAREFDRLDTISRLIAAEHKQITEGARQLLIALSASPEISSNNSSKCASYLSKLKQNYVRYINFGVINQRGQIICSADKDQAQTNPPSSRLLEQTLSENKFTIGSYYSTTPEGAVINFAYPLDSARLIYASLSLEWVSDFISTLGVPVDFVINILDQNGIVLARSPDTPSAIGQNFATDPLVQEILAKGRGQTTKIGIDQVLRLYSFTSLDNSHTTFVAVGLPQQTVYDSTQKSLIGSLITILVISTLSFMLAKKIGQHLIIKQLESLKKLDQLKDEFISLVSHQLRSPMTAIRWLSESLLESKSHLSKSNLLNISKIHATTLRLIAMTTTLLNISRLESGALTIRPKIINLKQFLDQIMSELKPIAGRRGIRFTTNKVQGTLTTDSILLKEVLHIILENAISYSMKNTLVKIIVAESSTDFTFKISNSGIGIRSESVPYIFTRFYRDQSARTLRPNGNGLGLYLAHLITTKIGGKLSFNSKPGKLTTFTLSLPKGIINL